MPILLRLRLRLLRFGDHRHEARGEMTAKDEDGDNRVKKSNSGDNHVCLAVVQCFFFGSFSGVGF